jgi:uncharacterized protein involved in exopolysaccharide biosynthesis
MDKNKRGIISIEELNLPDKPARAPLIDWGKDFEEFDDEGKIRYLKRLTSALNHSCDLIQKERNDAYKQCQVMAEQLENADKNVSIQKGILHNALTNYNKEKQDLIKRIQELESETKDLNVKLLATEARLKKYEDR